MLCNYMNKHPCEIVKNMRKPITISAMNTHLREDMYEHFDNFNASYSPFGNGQLRHVYLKTEGGQHFANLFVARGHEEYDKVYERSPDIVRKFSSSIKDVRNSIHCGAGATVYVVISLSLSIPYAM